MRLRKVILQAKRQRTEYWKIKELCDKIYCFVNRPPWIIAGQKRRRIAAKSDVRNLLLDHERWGDLSKGRLVVGKSLLPDVETAGWKLEKRPAFNPWTVFPRIHFIPAGTNPPIDSALVRTIRTTPEYAPVSQVININNLNSSCTGFAVGSSSTFYPGAERAKSSLTGGGWNYPSEISGDDDWRPCCWRMKIALFIEILADICYPAVFHLLLTEIIINSLPG